MLNFFYECMLSRFSQVQLFVTPWTVALQAPLSMGVSKQEYWSGLPRPSPGDISDPHLLSPALAGRENSWEAQISCIIWWYLTYESESESHSVVPDSLPLHGLYRPWNSSGQNTWVGILSLLQEIFPAQGSNPGLLHCRWILYQLSHKRRPRILGWVAYPFSSRSSWPRNWTRVSCISGGFFASWAIREAPICSVSYTDSEEYLGKMIMLTSDTQYS